MRRILVTVPFLLVLAACSTPTPSPTQTPVPSPTMTVSPTPQPSVAPGPATTASDPAAVDPAPQGYLDELRVIDPKLAENENQALDRGQNTCADLKATEFTDEQLVARVQERFSGGDLQLDNEQARRVLDAVRRRLC